MSLATLTKPRILCLHGRCQSGSSFSHKISGARRKLSRQYELIFLDGPISLETENDDNSSFAWWTRDEQNGQHIRVEEAVEYVQEFTRGQQFDALLGFSQGGTLAIVLALSGTVPGIKAVVTAGAPMAEEVLNISSKLACNIENGKQIPKLHLAGETDTMVPFESTEKLCESGGNGRLIVHGKGHMFPTKASFVNNILDFLDESLIL